MRPLAGALLILCTLLGPAAARAFENDLVLSKLGNPTDISNGGITKAADPLAQERFARFSGEFALALAPQPAGLAATVGDAGFSLAFTSDLAFINPAQKFSSGEMSHVWPVETSNAPSTLFLPTLQVRKGLPFSLEIGADFSYLAFSTMVATTGTLKWTIVEGFQWWPDLGVRAFATGVLGTGALNMLVAGWDVGGSYRIPVAGGAELGLYGGYQRFGMNSSTNNIDFNPSAEDEASPISDDTVFQELSYGKFYDPTTALSRLYFGLQVRFVVLVVGADFSTGSGTYAIAAGSQTTVDVSVWKAAARIGVQF